MTKSLDTQKNNYFMATFDLAVNNKYMKKVFRLVSIITTVFFYSCAEKQTEDLNIEIIVSGPEVKDKMDILPELYRKILEPIEVATDTILIPKIVFNRVDLNKKSQLKIDTSGVGAFAKLVGTYTYQNYKNDFDEQVESLKSNDILSIKKSETLDYETNLNETDNLLTFYKDTTEVVNNINSFKSVDILRKHISDQFLLSKNSNFKVYISDKTNVPSVDLNINTVQIENLIKDGDFNKAQYVCEQLYKQTTNKKDLIKLGLDLESRADNMLKSFNCDFIVNPIGYLVCAYELLGKDQRIEGKYNQTINKARKNCKLTPFPSINSYSNRKTN